MKRPSRWGGRQVAAWRAAVLAAYGSVCCLCHQPIDLALTFPNPRSFSIEHRIPRSKGGPDTLANMRPCHLGCNSARGNRSTAPQRRPRRVGRFSLPAAVPEAPPLPVSPPAPEKNASNPD